MIIGTVSPDFQATVRVIVLGMNGRAMELEAVIDTGFNGDLTLPGDTIAELSLPLIGHRRIFLADGSQQFADVYEALVDWDGQTMIAQVDMANTKPLIGMALMEGYGLHIEVVAGGAVTIERL